MIYCINSDSESKLFADYYNGTRVLIRVYNNGDIFCSSSKIEVLNDYMKSKQYNNFLNSIMELARVVSNDGWIHFAFLSKSRTILLFLSICSESYLAYTSVTSKLPCPNICATSSLLTCNILRASVAWVCLAWYNFNE